MANHNRKSAPDLPALPLPEALLVYGNEESRFKPEGRLFQWRFDGLERIQYVANVAEAQKALQALQGKPFTPVIIFNQGESSNVLKIFRHDLPDFAAIDALDEPEEAEYALCNPEATVEAVWYPLLEGEPIAEPPDIWHNSAFLDAYGEAFVQWLRRHPERRGMQPMEDLALDDFQILAPPTDGRFRLAHKGFPLAWVDVERDNASAWQATPGGALDGIEADELYVLHNNKSMALAEVPREVWDKRLSIPAPVKPKTTDSVTKKVIEKVIGKVIELTDFQNPVGPYRIPLMAHSAKTDEDARELKLECLGGECIFGLEDILNNDKQRILRFSCSETVTPKLSGQRVRLQIGSRIYDLGTINKNGVAKIKIERTADFWQGDITLILPDYREE